MSLDISYAFVMIYSLTMQVFFSIKNIVLKYLR